MKFVVTLLPALVDIGSGGAHVDVKFVTICIYDCGPYSKGT